MERGKRMSLLKKEFYIESMKKFEEAYAEVEKMKQSRDDKRDISDYIERVSNEIESNLKVNRIELLEKSKERQREIEHEHELKREYVEPQVEALQRQDFDMKIKLMTCKDLKSFIDDIEKGYQLNDYQTKALMIELKERQNEPEYSTYNLESSLMSLYAYSENVLGKEYKETEEYQELEQTIIDCVSYGDKLLWKKNIITQDLEMIPYADELNKLIADYNVSLS